MIEGLIGCLVGLGFIAIGARFLHLALTSIHLFERCPKRRIWQLKPGMYAQVSGRVLGKPQLISPISQTPCNFWQCTAIETVKNGKHTSRRVLYKERSVDLITLTDTTGKVRVRPKNASLYRRPAFQDSQSLVHTFKDPRVAPALYRFGVLQHNLFHIRRSLSVTEHLFQEGKQVFVWGQVEVAAEQPTSPLQMSPLLLSDWPRSAQFGLIAGRLILAMFLLLLGAKVVVEMLGYMLRTL